MIVIKTKMTRNIEKSRLIILKNDINDYRFFFAHFEIRNSKKRNQK